MGKFILVLSILNIVLSGCSRQTETASGFSETVSAQATTNISRFHVGTAPGSLEIADFNGDGKYDVVVANEESNDATFLPGDSKGGFAAEKAATLASGKMPNDIAVADFDKDKKLDLAFANHESDYLTVLLGDGKGNFKPSSKSPFKVQVKPHPHGVAAGDLNGDGILDLVTDSWENDRLAVLNGDGQGNFNTSAQTLKVGRHPYQRVRVADVNKDGKADVLTTNLRGNNLTVLFGRWYGRF